MKPDVTTELKKSISFDACDVSKSIEAVYDVVVENVAHEFGTFVIAPRFKIDVEHCNIYRPIKLYNSEKPNKYVIEETFESIIGNTINEYFDGSNSFKKMRKSLSKCHDLKLMLASLIEIADVATNKCVDNVRATKFNKKQKNKFKRAEDKLETNTRQYDRNKDVYFL